MKKSNVVTTNKEEATNTNQSNMKEESVMRTANDFKGYTKEDLVEVLVDMGYAQSGLMRRKKAELINIIIEEDEMNAYVDEEIKKEKVEYAKKVESFKAIDFDAIARMAVLTDEATGMPIDRIDDGNEHAQEVQQVPKVQEVQVVQKPQQVQKVQEVALPLTNQQKIAIAKQVKDACVHTKMSAMGVSLRDARNIIAKTIYNTPYYEFKTTKVITGVYRGEDVYENRRYLAEADLTKDQKELIDNTLRHMIHGNCLRPNHQGTYFFITQKLLHWNFAA